MKTFEGIPTTTKTDKILHGWELQSVRDAVEKYNGTIECNNESENFVVTVMLMYDIK